MKLAVIAIILMLVLIGCVTMANTKHLKDFCAENGYGQAEFIGMWDDKAEGYCRDIDSDAVRRDKVVCNVNLGTLKDCEFDE